MPEISVRGIEMPESPIRKLAPLSLAAKKRGVKVYHLNIGQPDLPTPQVGLDALKNIDRKVLEYSPSQGIASYREKLIGYYNKYNIDIESDDIIITTGGSEAVLFAFFSCLNPGDEIIIPEPAYANYMAFAIAAGAKIRTITTTIEEGFSLPKVEKFEELINERTRAILICNPNNPTGNALSIETIDYIAGRIHCAFLLDEAYTEFCDQSAVSLLKKYDHLMIARTFSKAYSLASCRVGYMLAHRDIIDMAAKTYMPYHINTLSLTTADTVFQMRAEFEPQIQMICGERDRMQEKYKHLRGVTVYPSYTNFILIHYAGACALNDELIHQGIGVRSFHNAPRLEDTLRISMGRPDENDAVFRAIKDYVEART